MCVNYIGQANDEVAKQKQAGQETTTDDVKESIEVASLIRSRQ